MPGHEISEAVEQSKHQAAEQQRQRIEQRAANAQDVVKAGDRQATPTDQADPRIVERFTDKMGRVMSVRRTTDYDVLDGGGRNGIRFYELRHGDRQAGRLSLEMERSDEHKYFRAGDPNVYDRVRIVNIEIDPPYQRAGSSEHLLVHVENEAMKHHAREIHGNVTTLEAESYWRHMSKDGWQLQRTPGEGLSVHKSMSS